MIKKYDIVTLNDVKYVSTNDSTYSKYINYSNNDYNIHRIYNNIQLIKLEHADKLFTLERLFSYKQNTLDYENELVKCLDFKRIIEFDLNNVVKIILYIGENNICDLKIDVKLIDEKYVFAHYYGYNSTNFVINQLKILNDEMLQECMYIETLIKIITEYNNSSMFSKTFILDDKILDVNVDKLNKCNKRIETYKTLINDFKI